MAAVNDGAKAHDLETRIAQGDRDAMAQFLALALENKTTKSELKRRYQLVWGSDHGNDSMILRNLSIVAAAIGEFQKTSAFAEDFIQSLFLSDAFHSALALRGYGADQERIEAERILSELASLGHIRTQVLLCSEKFSGQGGLKHAWFQIYRAYKILQALVLSAKSPEDPRVLI